MALLFILVCFLIVGGKQAEFNGLVAVRCGFNEMEVYISKSFIPNFKIEELRLIDPDCQTIKSENTTYFTILAPLVGCGTTTEHTAENVIYRNMVKDQYVSEAIISRLQVLEIPFECSYPKEKTLPLFGLDVRQASIIALPPEDGSGMFDLEMTIFKDGKYGEIYSAEDFPIAVSLQQRLYFQISVDTPDTRLGIVADACFATPMRRRTAQEKYDIITDRCSKDATVMFHDGPLTTQRFSFEAFQFINGQVEPYVFIHCQVILCNMADPASKCKTNCDNKTTTINTRLRRSESIEEYNLEQGPIVFIRDRDWYDELVEEKPENEDHAVGREGDQASNMMTWLCAVIGLICLMCLVAVLDAVRNVRAKAKKTALLRL